MCWDGSMGAMIAQETLPCDHPTKVKQADFCMQGTAIHACFPPQPEVIERTDGNTSGTPQERGMRFYQRSVFPVAGFATNGGRRVQGNIFSGPMGNIPQETLGQAKARRSDTWMGTTARLGRDSSTPHCWSQVRKTCWLSPRMPSI